MNTRVLKSGKCTITQEYKSNHLGIDLVKEGYQLDYITAHSDGKVIQVISNCNANTKNDSSNPGNMVKIEHSNGYVTRYLHLSYGSVCVKVGDYVKKGQVIGYMGNTGYSFGGHLHFDLWKDGTRINPYNYLNSDLPGISCETLNKDIHKLALDVIAGKYGVGQERKNKLGSKYQEVQNEVNKILAGKSNKKSVDELVKEVIQGKWGNGKDRKTRLTNAGYDYRTIQNRVNEMLR